MSKSDRNQPVQLKVFDTTTLFPFAAASGMMVSLKEAENVAFLSRGVGFWLIGKIIGNSKISSVSEFSGSQKRQNHESFHRSCSFECLLCKSTSARFRWYEFLVHTLSVKLVYDFIQFVFTTLALRKLGSSKIGVKGCWNRNLDLMVKSQLC